MAAARKPRIKVGVIGLGIIGTRVAANLRAAGHQVYVWSRTPRAAPNFLGSVVEVADLCDVIQMFVSDDTALHEVTRTIAAALSPRHVIACHATVSPDTTRQAAQIVEAQGARYLDAPFTGSKVAAQNRQLVYYVGGNKNALEEARPILEASSKAVLYVGAVGDASVLKIATNMLTASTVQTLAEALALVRAAGIEPEHLVRALENNASHSGTSDLKLPAMIAGRFEANFSLKHMLKDVRLAQDLADRFELALPVTDATSEVLDMGMQNGWADDDFCVVAQLYSSVAEETTEATAEGAPAENPTTDSAAESPKTDSPPSPVPDPASPAASAGSPDAIRKDDGNQTSATGSPASTANSDNPKDAVATEAGVDVPPSPASSSDSGAAEAADKRDLAEPVTPGKG